MNNSFYSTLVWLFEKGGVVMYPLALASVCALAIIIERLLWGPSRQRAIPPRLLEDIRSLLAANRYEELVGRCRGEQSVLAKIMLVALSHSTRPRDEMVEAVEVAGRREAFQLQRYVGLLGTIAAVSPLLGLLGTVFGMIRTFSVIEAQGLGNAPALAGGIAEALITTAAGLTIAIPSLVFHRLFLSHTRRLILETEAISVELVSLLMRNADTSPEEISTDLCQKKSLT